MFRRPNTPYRGYIRRDTADLVMWIQRLVRAPHYNRAAVTSKMLQRYLPANRLLNIQDVERKIEMARLDETTFDYLLSTLKINVGYAQISD
jgi:hypothetical protein